MLLVVNREDSRLWFETPVPTKRERSLPISDIEQSGSKLRIEIFFHRIDVDYRSINDPFNQFSNQYFLKSGRNIAKTLSGNDWIKMSIIVVWKLFDTPIYVKRFIWNKKDSTCWSTSWIRFYVAQRIVVSTIRQRFRKREIDRWIRWILRLSCYRFWDSVTFGKNVWQSLFFWNRGNTF